MVAVALHCPPARGGAANATPEAPEEETKDSSTSPSGPVKNVVSQARKVADLPSLLALVAEALARKEQSPANLAGLLSLLAAKARPLSGSADEATSETLRVGEALLEAATLRSGGSTPPESAVTSMVRLCCTLGVPERALALVDEACAAGMKPKVRTLAAILVQAASSGDTKTCEGVWAKLAALSLEPQDTEYAAMLRGLRGSRARQMEILRQMLVDLPLPSEELLVEELGRVFGVEAATNLQEADPAWAEGQPSNPAAAGEAEEAWRVGWTSISAEGLCALTHRQLQALQISPAEEKLLSACAGRLANDSGSNANFRLFQKWTSEQEPWDVIIDGANVGYSCQNRQGGEFSYVQIDAVVRLCLEQSQRVLLVLHPKWLREDVDRSTVKRKKRRLEQISGHDEPPPEEEGVSAATGHVLYPHEGVTEAEREAEPGSPLHLIRSWKELGVLLCVPMRDCDDWYWIYAALDSFRRGYRHVQVISNDNMRDHHWRMHGLPAFVQWQDRHMTRVYMKPAGEGQEAGTPAVPALASPLPYSLRAQVSQDERAWHFPVPVVRTRAEQIQTGRPVGPKEVELAEKRWLVAWRPTPKPVTA